MAEVKAKDSFGAKLRDERTSAALSLRALARSTELDPAYLSRVERGHNPAPRQVVIDGLASALCKARGLSDADCERLRRSLLQAAGRLADEQTLISDLRHRFADRLRDEGLDEWAVNAAIGQVDLDTMQRVLVGDEPLEIAPALAFSAAEIRDREAREPVVVLEPAKAEPRTQSEFDGDSDNRPETEPRHAAGTVSAADYLSQIEGQFEGQFESQFENKGDRGRTAPPEPAGGRARPGKPARHFAAGPRARIVVQGDLSAAQEKQLRQAARLIATLFETEQGHDTTNCD